MTYQEYNDRRNDIVNAYNNGEVSLPDLQYGITKLDRDYESTYPVSTFPDWSKRAEEALAKMKGDTPEGQGRMGTRLLGWRQGEGEERAHACLDDGRVKVKKGIHGLLFVDTSILEARLLANEILSITNKQRRKRK